jgi:hypothetical protein
MFKPDYNPFSGAGGKKLRGLRIFTRLLFCLWRRNYSLWQRLTME